MYVGSKIVKTKEENFLNKRLYIYRKTSKYKANIDKE